MPKQPKAASEKVERFGGLAVIHSRDYVTRSIVLVCLALLCVDPGQAQDLEAQARALRPADPSPLSKAADDDLERRAHEALDGIRRARRSKDIEDQRPVLRKRLEKSLGMERLPWPPDLQPTLTGRVEREGYRIEKLAFQTLPGMWVPAHAYLPGGSDEPAPAVLVSSANGWDEGKSHPDAQAFAINSVRLGLLVLVFDAMGQGERAGSPAGYRGAELRLLGVTQQALVQYEIRCALRYLQSRLDVDPERIGLVGSDGGGFATWIAAALDEDIAAAVVADDTTDFHEQIRYFRSLDEYEIDDHRPLIPGIYRYANQHELLALVAPRPVLIVQPTEDAEFPIQGARAVYEYGAETYAALHKRKGIVLIEEEGSDRGLQKSKREAAYGWLVHWLNDRDDDKPIEEPETEVEPPDSIDLAVLPEGRTASAAPGIDAFVTGLINDAAQRKEFLPDNLVNERPPNGPCHWHGKIGHLTRHTHTAQRGVRIPLLSMRPGPIGASPANGVLVAIDDRGKEELVSDPIVREAVEKRGWQIRIIDPRGIGEMRGKKAGWAYRTSLLMGEDFVWRQAEDIRYYVECADRSASHIVGLYARGPNATLAAAYALATARPQPEFAVFRDGFLSFREVVQRKDALESASGDGNTEADVSLWGDETPDHWFPLGGLQAGDLPAFFEARRGREFIIDPLYPQPVPPQAGDPESSPFTFISLEDFLLADWE